MIIPLADLQIQFTLITTIILVLFIAIAYYSSN